MKTFAVIPTKFASPDTLFNLLNDLSKDDNINKIYVLNNTSTDIRISIPKVVMLDFENYTIYEMWNRAWEYIRYNYPKQGLNIAFLNDDIELAPHSIFLLKLLLREDETLAAVYPDINANWLDFISGWYNKDYEVEYSTGTSAYNGGLLGYCFMIKGELEIPYIDENLKLYWGDDDLVKQVLKAGYKIGKITGLPIKHIGSATIRTMDATERANIMEKDRQYFNTKYNENRGPAW